ncbi:hypothetical protein [Jeotgalicoccus sp. S0W5]|nr:hypothetical protein [Jeotgalicoccus sp. S0W5]
MKDNARNNIDELIEQTASTLRNYEINSNGGLSPIRGNKCPAY